MTQTATDPTTPEHGEFVSGQVIYDAPGVEQIVLGTIATFFTKDGRRAARLREGDNWYEVWADTLQCEPSGGERWLSIDPGRGHRREIITIGSVSIHSHVFDGVHSHVTDAMTGEAYLGPGGDVPSHRRVIARVDTAPRGEFQVGDWARGTRAALTWHVGEIEGFLQHAGRAAALLRTTSSLSLELVYCDSLRLDPRSGERWEALTPDDQPEVVVIGGVDTRSTDHSYRVVGKHFGPGPRIPGEHQLVRPIWFLPNEDKDRIHIYEVRYGTLAVGSVLEPGTYGAWKAAFRGYSTIRRIMGDTTEISVVRCELVSLAAAVGTLAPSGPIGSIGPSDRAGAPELPLSEHEIARLTVRDARLTRPRFDADIYIGHADEPERGRSGMQAIRCIPVRQPGSVGVLGEREGHKAATRARVALGHPPSWPEGSGDDEP